MSESDEEHQLASAISNRRDGTGACSSDTELISNYWKNTRKDQCRKTSLMRPEPCCTFSPRHSFPAAGCADFANLVFNHNGLILLNDESSGAYVQLVF